MPIIFECINQINEGNKVSALEAMALSTMLPKVSKFLVFAVEIY